MSVRTTLNMHITTKKEIVNAARKLHTTEKDIIVILLHYMLNYYKKLHVSFKGVQYQDSDEKGNWVPFHIRFSGKDYEFFTDERKFYKISVSLLVAMAVKLFLSKLLTIKNVRNYVPISSYSIRFEEKNQVIHWIITWNQPQFIKSKVIIN